MDGSTPKLITALTNTPVAVKAGPGQVRWGDFYNSGNAVAYVQFFDAAAGDVTLGTTVPALSIAVPAGERAPGPSDAVVFNTAISVAATATATGSGAPNATQSVNLAIR